MPYGWRMVRAWGVGVILASIVLLALTPSTPPVLGTFILTAAALVVVATPLVAVTCKLRYARKAIIVGSIWLLIYMLMMAGKYLQQQEASFETLWDTTRSRLFIAVLIAFSPPLFIHVKERLLESQHYRRAFVIGDVGTSRWAGPNDIGRYTIWTFDWWKRLITRVRGEALKLPRGYVYLGMSMFLDDLFPRHVATHDDAHLLVVGQSGSGKKLTHISPVIGSYNGPLIVIDPKNEHEREWAEFRARPEFGGTSFVLKPFASTPGAHYNLLSEIDINGRNARKLISAISTASIMPASGDNKIFEELGRMMLDGAIAHLMSTRPKSEHNLPAVVDMLIGIDPETGEANPEQFAQTVEAMLKNRAVGGLPQQAAATLQALGDRTYGSVIAELQTGLKWVTDSSMRVQLSKSDFAFTDLHKPGSKMAVFIALPFGDMAEQMRWLRTIVQLSARILEAQENKPDTRILYVLDELAQYGQQCPIILQGVVTLREAGVKMAAYFQNWKQALECLGEEGAKNFESSSTTIVFGVNDTTTGGWISEKLGKHHFPVRKGWRRKIVSYRVAPLVEPASVVTELSKSSPMQFVFPMDGSPLRLERMATEPVKIDKQHFFGLGLRSRQRWVSLQPTKSHV